MANYYDPPAQKIQAKEVGTTYHLGLGTTTPGQASNDRIYGYMLVPDPQSRGLEQVTDLQAKGKLQSYSSEHLIDRDFVNYPRVTDGDFSGGGLQVNYLDTARYWDSDLETSNAGLLALRAGWQQRTLSAVDHVPVTSAVGAVSWKGDAYFSDSGVYYDTNGTGFAPLINAVLLATDGNLLYISDGVNNLKSTPDNAVFTVITAASGAIKHMWPVATGTGGRFLYFTTDNTVLQKQDLTVAWAPAVVPTATTPFSLVEVVPYLAGVAILTQDRTGTTRFGAATVAPGFDVWYHDGANMSRIVRVDGYTPTGMQMCLGSLYITTNSPSEFGAPSLIRIGSGSFDVVLRVGAPLPSIIGSTLMSPVASGTKIYFIVHTPQFTGISAKDYIGTYDVLTGAYSHLGNSALIGGDVFGSAPLGSPYVKLFAVSGNAVGFPHVDISAGIPRPFVLQFQRDSAVFTTGAALFATSGWLASSRIDFNTPGISKMFRRIIVHHAPLATGESIKVNGYVDVLPTTWTTGTAATATVTNSTVGISSTVLTFPSNTQGFSMMFALQLTAGTSQATTPQVYYVATEITTPWGFQFTVDCTTKRRTLQQQEDPQGLKGRDLYYLLKNAWENGNSVTLYHPAGETYVCTIEQLRFVSPSPQYGTATPLKASDFECWATLTLRHTSVA